MMRKTNHKQNNSDDTFQKKEFGEGKYSSNVE